MRGLNTRYNPFWRHDSSICFLLFHIILSKPIPSPSQFLVFEKFKMMPQAIKQSVMHSVSKLDLLEDVDT